MSDGRISFDDADFGAVVYTLPRDESTTSDGPPWGVISGNKTALIEAKRNPHAILYLVDGKAVVIKITHANLSRALFELAYPATRV